MITAEGLTKVFGDQEQQFLAVDALDVEIPQGEVFGFLGPNGAGKTTTVRMLATLVGVSSGRAWVDGTEVGTGKDALIRSRIGILTESPGLYERLSAQHNLRIFAELYGCADPARQVEKYLRLLGLWERRNDAAGTFSKGMKQKVAIARALVHEPAVLFLDEPTSGLDPEAAKNVCDFVETLRGQGRTIFLCTHNLDEAERLCDRVAVFQQRLIALDSPDALRLQLFGRQTVVRLAPDSPPPDLSRLAELLPSIGPATVVAGDGQSGAELTFSVRAPHLENPEIVRALVEGRARIESVTEVRHSLEDIYLSLIRDAAGEGNHR